MRIARWLIGNRCSFYNGTRECDRRFRAAGGHVAREYSVVGQQREHRDGSGARRPLDESCGEEQEPGQQVPVVIRPVREVGEEEPDQLSHNEL